MTDAVVEHPRNESPQAETVGGTGCDNQRNGPEYERERSHYDRPKTQPGSPQRRAARIAAAAMLLDRELDDQDCILTRQTDQKDQPDLRVDIVL